MGPFFGNNKIKLVLLNITGDNIKKNLRYGGPYQIGPTVHTKTYICRYVCLQHLALFNLVSTFLILSQGGGILKWVHHRIPISTMVSFSSA